jgi:putative heme-binding domain-containing protein
VRDTRRLRVRIDPVWPLLTALLVIAVLPAVAQRSGRIGLAPVVLPPGDAVNGKLLVESNRCLTCHRIGTAGSRVGPDLSNVGNTRTPDQLERAIVAPDDEVLPENRFVRVVLKDGATVTGRLLNQDAFTIQLLDSTEQLRSYAKANLRSFAILTTGLMPSFKDTLSSQQIDDIVNYLASLKGASQ